MFIIVFVRFFGRFGLPFWTVSGSFLERFRPENGQKGPFFFCALRAPNFEKQKGVHYSFCEILRFQKGVFWRGGGLLIVIPWYGFGVFTYADRYPGVLRTF